MEGDDFQYVSSDRFDKIPDFFKEFETNKLISHCKICEKELIESRSNYFIEKAVKQYPDQKAIDVLFEYAVCLDCAIQEGSKLYSVESKAVLRQFFATRVDMETRSDEFFEKNGRDFKKWTSNCVFSGKSQKSMGEYQIIGHFLGDEIIYNGFPYTIGEEAADEIIGLLSEETKDNLGDFMGDVFGPPSEFSDLFPKRVPTLI